MPKQLLNSYSIYFSTTLAQPLKITIQCHSIKPKVHLMQQAASLRKHTHKSHTVPTLYIRNSMDLYLTNK